MGWPKKDEGYRLYYERKHKSYLLVDPETTEYLGELMSDNDPDVPVLMTGYGVSPLYLYKNCKRLQWDEMPIVWRTAIRDRMRGDDGEEFDPKKYRGLWRV